VTFIQNVVILMKPVGFIFRIPQKPANIQWL